MHYGRGVEFRILGPLAVLEDGRPLRLSAGKQPALVAARLLQPNQFVSTERLIFLLWGDEPSYTAHNALQVYISQLRRLLEAECRRAKPPAHPRRQQRRLFAGRRS
jgi:DNA-binding SARP family transcriptional activator